MQEFNIELLAHKRLTNQITESESKILEEARNSDASLAKTVEEIEFAWATAKDLSPDLSFESKAAFQKFLSKIEERPIIIDQPQQEKSFKVISLRSIMAVAAMFALAFFAFNLLTKPNLTTYNSNSTPSVVFLPEGSEVKLAPNSSITYVKSNFPEDRKIQLSGSGVIHVEKTGKPFIVEGKDFQVRVLGTTFLVESNATQKSVKVLEGKVEVSHDNMKVVITDKQGTTIDDDLTIDDNVSFSDMSWNINEMVYNNTPVSKVFADVESKFGVSIALKSTQSVQNCTFTSQSLAQLNLDQVLNILEATFSTKFTKTAEKIYAVSALSCK
jgi:transmembrane sensor